MQAPERPAAVPIELPPGPGRLRTFQFVRAPFDFLDHCQRTYGDWFTVQPPGLPAFVFTSDPLAIGEVFSGSSEDLRAGEANASLGPFMGAQSLLLLDGATHLHERRLLLPPFHGDRMHAYGAAIARITRAALDALPQTTLSLHPLLQQITFDTILTAVFGLEEGPRRSAQRQAFARLFSLFNGPFAMLLGVPAFQLSLGGSTPWARLQRLRTVGGPAGRSGRVGSFGARSPVGPAEPAGWGSRPAPRADRRSDPAGCAGPTGPRTLSEAKNPTTRRRRRWRRRARRRSARAARRPR